MAWRIINGRYYYYKSVRIEGRTHSIYCGGGERGRLEAGLVEIERDQRALQDEAQRAERERLDAEDRREAEWCKGVERVARFALVAAGFCQHQRGPWMKRRVPKAKAKAKDQTATALATAEAREPLSPQQTKALLKRLADGDAKALPEFRRYLKHEGAHQLAGTGSMKDYAESAIIEDFSCKNLGVRELLEQRLDALRLELAGENPTPLEKLLVQRVAFCWLALYRNERRIAQDEGQTFDMAEYYQRNVDRANRRFLSACKTLATVRRLAIPEAAFTLVQNLAVALAPAAGASSGSLDIPTQGDINNDL